MPARTLASTCGLVECADRLAALLQNSDVNFAERRCTRAARPAAAPAAASLRSGPGAGVVDARGVGLGDRHQHLRVPPSPQFAIGTTIISAAVPNEVLNEVLNGMAG